MRFAMWHQPRVKKAPYIISFASASTSKVHILCWVGQYIVVWLSSSRTTME